MKLNFALGLLLIIVLSSCATYHISTQSLVEQLVDSQKEDKVSLVIAPPFFFPFIVTGNNLESILVLDKNEKEYLLSVTSKTSVRVIKIDGKKKIFYFNTLLIKDSTITGKMDHFIGTNIKPIPLSKIAKIELQKH